MNPIWIGSPSDVREGPHALQALTHTSDAAFVGPDGIARVSIDRWVEAQQFEHDCWLRYCLGAADDRSEEHAAGFDQYACLRDRHFAEVIEAGCGPFTQLLTVLRTAGARADRATLVDPLLDEYRGHPHCAYRTGTLPGLPTELICSPVEDLKLSQPMDLAVSINVIEHVRDANSYLRTLRDFLRPGGVLVFHDRSWERTSPATLYDVGHPIRLLPHVLDRFLAGFRPLLSKRTQHEGGTSFYFVGTLA